MTSPDTDAIIGILAICFIGAIAFAYGLWIVFSICAVMMLVVVLAMLRG